MADITNAEAIRFVNEQIRPLCEEARALKVRITSMHSDWTDRIGAMFPADESPVVDGREDEGVSRLTGYDVGAAHDSLVAASAQINNAYIDPPCVRAISAG